MPEGSLGVRLATDSVSAGTALEGVPDGSTIGLGGLLLSRRPTALCRALLRHGVRDTTIVGIATSFDAEAMLGLGAVRRVRSAFHSLGVFGLGPAHAQAAGDGTVELQAETEMSIVLGLRAALAGIGFLPMRAWDGTDYGRARPDVRPVTCPYSGDELVAFPRIDVDVALIHGLFADEAGNVHLGSDLAADRELARAAGRTVVSVERRVTGQLTDADRVDVLACDIDALVVAPAGAHPTACVPEYGVDGAFLQAYLDAAADARLSQFLSSWTAEEVAASESV